MWEWKQLRLCLSSFLSFFFSLFPSFYSWPSMNVIAPHRRLSTKTTIEYTYTNDRNKKENNDDANNNKYCNGLVVQPLWWLFHYPSFIHIYCISWLNSACDAFKELHKGTTSSIEMNAYNVVRPPTTITEQRVSPLWNEIHSGGVWKMVGFRFRGYNDITTLG